MTTTGRWLVIAGLVSMHLTPTLTTHSPLEAQFRARTELVRIDVVVTNRSGEPVTGLTAADFSILDSGQPQAISLFEPVSIPVGNRDLDIRRPLPVRDVATNLEPPSPRAIVVVIDSYHLTTDAETLERLRRALRSLLESAHGQDDVAIVFTRRSDLSVPFTRDLARQLAAVDAITASAYIGGRQPPQVSIANIRRSLWTVRNAIEILGRMPHPRRVLFYVGEGPPVELGRPTGPSSTATGEVRMTLDAALRAGVVLSAIDPRGTLDASEFERRRVQHDFLAALTLDVGGVVVGGAARVNELIRGLVEQNGSFYLLGYRPTPLHGDGKFHPIEVKVRGEGLRVRARKGYFAEPRVVDTPPEPATPEAAVVEALEASSPVAAVPLHVTAAPVAPGRDGKVQTLLTISGGALDGQATDIPWDVTVVALTPDAKVQSVVTEACPTLVDSVARTYSTSLVVELSPGVRPVRVAVRDPATGNVGTVHLSLDISDVDDDRLAIGGFVLGYDAPRTTVPAAVSAMTDRPVRPTTDRRFTPARVPTLLVPFFWDLEKDGVLEVTATIRRGEQTAASTQAVVAGRKLGDRAQGVFEWRLPIADLGPEEYRLDIEGEYDGRRVRQAIPFSVADVDR
jgi:VWFA-related protein